MVSLHKLVLVTTLAAALAALACSSEGSDTGSSSTGPHCFRDTGPIQTCLRYMNLQADQQSAMKDACTQQSGSVLEACPTEGQVGCCRMNLGGFDVDICYYPSQGDGGGAADAGSTNDLFKDSCEQQGGSWTAS